MDKRRIKESAEERIRDMKRMNGLKRRLMCQLLPMAAIIIVFKLILIAIVPTESMEGTISAGSIILSTRYGIAERDIKRFDILIFNSLDDPETNYVKRVIGLPGETVEVKEGSVYVDGVEIDDSFVKSPMNRKGDGVYEVPEGCYFFLGDNRNNSNDSRFWNKKYVPMGNIKAKARMVLFPFADICQL